MSIFLAFSHFTDVFHLKFIKSNILNLNLRYSCIMSDMIVIVMMMVMIIMIMMMIITIITPDTGKY